jgi:hypothetical protein
VVSLGDSENAIQQASIFKPSGFTWRLGKCDPTGKHFQAKWHHFGDSENAIQQASIFKPSGITWRLGKCAQTII